MNNRLKVLRAERDWRQQDLAQRLGVSRQSVNAVETGIVAARVPHCRCFQLADRENLSARLKFVDDDTREHRDAGD